MQASDHSALSTVKNIFIMIGVQDKRELTNLVSQLSDRNSIILAIHASVSTRV